MHVHHSTCCCTDATRCQSRVNGSSNLFYVYRGYIMYGKSALNRNRISMPFAQVVKVPQPEILCCYWEGIWDLHRVCLNVLDFYV